MPRYGDSGQSKGRVCALAGRGAILAENGTALASARTNLSRYRPIDGRLARRPSDVHARSFALIPFPAAPRRRRSGLSLVYGSGSASAWPASSSHRCAISSMRARSSCSDIRFATSREAAACFLYSDALLLPAFIGVRCYGRRAPTLTQINSRGPRRSRWTDHLPTVRQPTDLL
jgi:hypothetical protein